MDASTGLATVGTFLFGVLWRNRGWKGRVGTAGAIDLIQSFVTQKIGEKFSFARNHGFTGKMATTKVVETVGPIILPKVAKQGSDLATSTGKVGIIGLFQAIASAGESAVKHLPELGNDVQKAWTWFQPKPDAKDPIIQYAKSLFTKTSEASSKEPLAITSGQENTLLQSPISIGIKANIATAVLGQTSFIAGFNCYKNGVKTTKDKIIAATGVASAAGFITGVVSPQVLSNTVDCSFNVLKRNWLPVGLAAITFHHVRNSYEEGLSTKKGRAQAAIGVGALTGTIASAILLNR